MAKVYISVGFNGIEQPQISIGDETSGFRIAGGKYDGMGREILRSNLTKRDADSIRQYLDRIESE